MAKKVTKKTTTKKKTTVRKPRRATKKNEVTVTEARTPEIAEAGGAFSRSTPSATTNA